MSSNSQEPSPEGEVMDRGGSEDMSEILDPCDSMEIRQYRRGWWQEFFCCQTKSDFRYYNGKELVAVSKEDFTFACRCCLGPCHSFDMTLTDTKEGRNFLEINRPFRMCPGTGKCVCNQEATIFSGDEHLGDIYENCWWFVPSFKVYDENEKGVYTIKPPTCFFGACVNCCPGGKNPCPHGFCMIPCEVYPMENGVVGKEPVGTLSKIPKRTFKECFHEINYYKVDFPENATAEKKGLLLGSSLLINAIYFEHSE
mmetsp:Transcript_7789/g.19297  ORF Transcript_7789/g.19297 Transcript_7789/m.19297 type:complete len:255 (-) Transcript_7789:125-889(-)